jgi:MscS family membrane protein
MGLNAQNPVATSAPPSHPSAPRDPLGRDSPQSSVFALQQACHDKRYERAARYIDLRRLPQAQRLKDGSSIALELCEVLDRDTQFEVANLSLEPLGEKTNEKPGAERVDSFKVNGKSVDLELERVTLRSGLGIWVFSPETVDNAPRILRMATDSPVEKYLPDILVKWNMFDTSLWRWIALILLVLVLTILSRLFSRGLLRLLEPLLKRIAPHTDKTVLESFVAPLQVLLVVALFRAGAEAIAPSPRVHNFFAKALAFVFFVGVAWLGMTIIDVAVAGLRSRLLSRRQGFTYSILPLGSRVLKIAIFLLTIAAVLSSWGYNTNSILAGMGLGGIAVALAAQKTVENLFGGVAVVSDRPVAVGDFCKFGDRTGTVEDIGLRSTRIRTLDRTLVTVPNGLFSSMTLENFDRRDKMLFHFMLNLQRDTNPDQVRTLLASISKILVEHPSIETGALPVRFIGVGTYSLDLEIFAYVRTRDGNEFMKVQQDLYLWILDAVVAAGTALAIPTQASISYSAAKQIEPDGALAARDVAGRQLG